MQWAQVWSGHIPHTTNTLQKWCYFRHYRPRCREIMYFVVSVCLSICLHSHGWSVWPTTLIFLYGDSVTMGYFTLVAQLGARLGFRAEPELSYKCEHPAARIRNSKPALKIRAEPCSHWRLSSGSAQVQLRIFWAEPSQCEMPLYVWMCYMAVWFQFTESV